MSFRINTNTQAALSLTSLNKTTDGIGQRQLRLATGSKINSAADDSAGFTISNKLTAKTRGQAQALSNIGDAKSMLTVAEGSLNATMDILQTMKEKAVQAGNSSMGTEERAAIQSQVEALSLEVADILSSAEFNGTALFDDDATTSLSFQVGDVSGGTFGASVGQMGLATLGLGSIATVAAGPVEAVQSVDEVLATAPVDVSATGVYNEYGAISGSPDPIVDATASRYGEDIDLYFEYDSSFGNEKFYWALSPAELNDPGTRAEFLVSEFSGNVGTLELGTSVEGDDWGSISIDFGAGGLDVNDGGAGFKVGLTKYVAPVVGNAASPSVEAGDFVSAIDLTDDAGVAAALTTIDAAIATVNATASGLGDVQNRLDFKAQNLETSMNNYDAANSRIADADFAKEQMEIVKLQILQQTGSAMFAQSNAAPQSVLSFF